MAYDTYGRPLRSNGEQPGYFGTHDSIPDYTNYYPSEPRDSDPSFRRREWESSRHRRSPSIGETKMPSETGFSETASMDSLSPEVIAALTAQITERVKRELFEHMKQTGSTDESIKATPMQRNPSNRSNSSSSPAPTTRRVYTPPSPAQPPRPTYSAPPMEEPLPMRSPPTSPSDKPGGVRFSDRTFRPSVGRTFSSLELSTIDQKWGRLFDSEGNATKRLGDALRGLANHLICSFHPKGTIVVTPSKMAAYYEAYSLGDKEPHPLLSMFRAQSNEQISQLYQDLGCEHHLVQETAHSAPVVPGLTPTGFAWWMTLFIIAYPELEWNRLEKVVPQLPIDADGDLVDGKPERLPKQISRHLLPEVEDRKCRKMIEDAVANFLDNLDLTSKRKPSITSPPPINRRSSTSQTRSHPVEIHQSKPSPTSSKVPPILERDRKPYSGTPGSDEETAHNNIERERQPYSAQPGSGKVYTENVSSTLPIRTSRSNSTSTRPAAREQPERIVNVDPPRTRNHSNSTAGQGYVPTSRRGRRTSSPPLKNFRNTAPENINDSSKYGPTPTSSASGFNPGSYGSAGSSFPPPPGPPPININPRDSNRDANRRSRDERSPWASSFDDDSRITSEVNGPRDAERLDRYREALEAERGGYDRASISVDPRDSRDSRDTRDSRGAPAEEWYRKEGRSNDYDYRRY